ncbi:Shikimate O-hydroxycinnamoyltransferase [Acorus gramineus]|uniref:Shikimate O-hydroxycinnamoyltransferase n=1 Tax=Acorus gramineus TaxID=55184 RepID=A0AAV9APX3_ACOGR|nr:Shikimate O-hydroxycinnamoyltransferase [Acorus gramineus]
MGSVSQTDLNIKIKSTSLVHPPIELERRSMFLSNIDQFLNVDMRSVHFFSSNQAFPPSAVCEAVGRALRELLVPYDFLAGRLKEDPLTGRFEIDCNGAGAGFVVASSERALEDMGDLTCPSPDIVKLVPSKSLPGLEDWPLMVIQITSFACGGFAMGISNNHVTFDGISIKMFLDNLASLAAGGPLSVEPLNDRHLFSFRSPPSEAIPNPDLETLDEDVQTRGASSTENIQTKLFRLTHSDIAALKDKANASASAPTYSSFNVLTAHIWRCKSLSAADGTDPNSILSVNYAVDIRPRLPLPPSYTGNGIFIAICSATYGELAEGTLSWVAELVREGAEIVTGEYVRSVVELLEGVPGHHGFAVLGGGLLVTSWWRLGLEGVEYPWGKALCYTDTGGLGNDVAVLLPDFRGSGGVNLLVSLRGDEMERFEKLFYDLLE